MVRSLILFLSLMYSVISLSNTINPATETAAPEIICNLPAPANLLLTQATPSTLSFSWNSVSGASGYYYVLTNQSNGQQTTGTTGNTNITHTGLAPGTFYKMEIAGVCPSNQQPGAFSERIAQTEGVIIDDFIANFQGDPQSGNLFPLYDASFNQGETMGFQILNTSSGESTIFTTGKTFEISNLIYRVRLIHDNSSVKWVMTNQDGNYNQNDRINGIYAKVWHNGVHVLNVKVPRDQMNATSLLWESLEGSNFEVSQLLETKNDDRSPANLQGSESETVRISPNPFSSTLSVSTGSAATIRIYDLNGRMVATQNIPEAQHQATFATDYLSKGVYMLQVETNARMEVFKIVKMD